MTPRILASSGGFVSSGRWNAVLPGGIIKRAIELSGAERPRVLLMMTASGDAPAYLLRTYQALSSLGVVADHLSLFEQPNQEPEQAIERADVIWVGGGSVANLLACWEVHGLAPLIRAAWEGGTVLSGVSAGSICWHQGGPTDSFGPTLRHVANGLGLLPYGNAVHYDSEEQRRPLTHQLVAGGEMSTTFATDDGVGILYEGDEPVEVIRDWDGDPALGSAAYLVTNQGGEVLERRLPQGPIVLPRGPIVL